MTLKAALVLAAIALSLPAAHSTDINGSGSTFVHPIMLKWAASYNAKTDAKVSYQAIGSGGGIQQVKAGMVTFGASDKPLAPEELKAAGLARFPLVIGGVVPVVNRRVIAVGTPITERPPHRSEHAQFTHSAPTLGV
ncbi:MAG: substrate-binding domain-containing protein [Burkholderiaceae bacterium]|nr:substrate-binding domain-containing protein [Burkholderiaceae bacterium]